MNTLAFFKKQALKVLSLKSKEYTLDKKCDNSLCKYPCRYHNFNQVYKLFNIDPKTALLMFQMKHIISIIDIIENPKYYDIDLLNKKFGDAINYFILYIGISKNIDDIAYVVYNLQEYNICTIKTNNQLKFLIGTFKTLLLTNRSTTKFNDSFVEYQIHILCKLYNYVVERNSQYVTDRN